MSSLISDRQSDVRDVDSASVGPTVPTGCGSFPNRDHSGGKTRSGVASRTTAQPLRSMRSRAFPPPAHGPFHRRRSEGSGLAPGLPALWRAGWLAPAACRPDADGRARRGSLRFADGFQTFGSDPVEEPPDHDLIDHKIETGVDLEKGRRVPLDRTRNQHRGSNT